MKGTGRRTESAEPICPPGRQLLEWDSRELTASRTVIDRHEVATEQAPRDRGGPHSGVNGERIGGPRDAGRHQAPEARPLITRRPVQWGAAMEVPGMGQTPVKRRADGQDGTRATALNSLSSIEAAS